LDKIVSVKVIGVSPPARGAMQHEKTTKSFRNTEIQKRRSCNEETRYRR